VNEDALRPEPVTSPDGAIQHSITENRPLYLPVYDFTGGGTWRMVDGWRDNPLFRIDAATGKLWFNSQPGYRVLNYENPQDEGADNIYDIRVERTAANGQREVVDLALTVQDIVRETNHDNSRGWTYGFTYAQVRPLIEARQDWTAEERTYASWLLQGNAWAMPEQGPLIITWSIHPQQRVEGELVDLSDDMVSKMRNSMLRATDAFEQAINIKFQEVAYGPDEYTGHALLKLYVGQSYVSSALLWGTSSSIRFSKHALENVLTFKHEIGHILGLKHPFDKSGSGISFAGQRKIFPHREQTDEHGNIVKSGFDSIMGYGNWDKQTMTEKDIKVLQFLYGAPNTDYEGLQDLLDLDIPPPAIIDWL
jgi:hypothetical protein